MIRFLCWKFFVIYAGRLAWCARLNSSLSPLSIPPSEYWDGDDGFWSSFGIEVGTPSQNIRLLPGTSATACTTIWAIIPDGCPAEFPTNCPDLRGSVFKPNQSSTWSTDGLPNAGLFSLYTYEESLLGLNGNAEYGYDNITLGWGAGLPRISHQLVAGIASSDFWIGSLGLSPLSTNFTTLDEPRPSMLTNLKNDSLIPSLSWAYTAGAYYLEPKVFGSLTLGGMDSSRFVPNNVTIPFGADVSRDLLVGIQSIVSDTSVASHPSNVSLLSTGIYAFIDSSVSHMWLPLETCKAFEQAFNLTWDNNTELYLLTEEQHENLLRLNANVTFQIGPSIVGGPSVEIKMPYGAFDLQASFPIMNTSSRYPYFPIRRAQNDSQYTFGRTFLQQAYIIADYGRSSFSVSQALFPNTSISQDLVSILPPDFEVSVTEPAPPNPQAYPSAKSIIVGSVVGFVGLCIIGVLTLLFFCIRNRRLAAVQVQSENSTEKEKSQIHEKPELDNNSASKVELEAVAMPIRELDSHYIRSPSSESHIGSCVTELQAAEVPAYELPASTAYSHTS